MPTAPIQLQIRDAVYAWLITINGTGDYHNDLEEFIVKDREQGSQIDSAWNVNLRILSDEKVEEDTCNEYRSLALRIEVTRRSSSLAVGDDLIRAMADIRRSLRDNRQLGGLCDDVGYVRTEKPMSELRQIISGELWVEFEVKYRTTSFGD